MAASKYKIQLKEDISTVVKVSELKNFVNLGRRIKYKHLRIKRDQEQQNLFHVYNKLVHWDIEDDLRYVTSIKVTLANDGYQLEKIQANPAKKIDYIEKDYDNFKFSNVEDKRIGVRDVENILDKLSHSDTEKVDISKIKQVEKVNFVSLGLSEWYFKIGINDQIIRIIERNSGLQDILDALADAQDSMKAGMSDHEAQEYYFEPLKEALGISWNKPDTSRKVAV